MAEIVVLDGAALAGDDLSWGPLEALGHCKVYERTPAELLLERAAGAEILLTNKVVLNATALAQLPELRYIGVLATGYNVIDLDAAKERQIVVTNVPGYSTPSVVQMTFALLLELANQVGHHAQLVRSGRWSAAPDFCFWDRPQLELAGLTLGIIGYGAIGRGVATVARALGMKILVHTRSPEKDPDPLVSYVELDALLAQSDVVTLHSPLTDSNRLLINRAKLSLMKPESLLINTGRGLLVDEEALAEALDQGRIAGVAVDTLSSEPPPLDNPLLQAKNCIITPHIAWATLAARRRLLSIVVENILAFRRGEPQNRVC